MTPNVRLLIVLGLLAVVVGHVVFAADRVLALPSGWHLDREAFEIRGNNLAILLRAGEGPPEARILQFRALSKPVVTTIPGRPWSWDYSENGDYLLVHFIGPTDEYRVALLDAYRAIRWIHDVPETTHYYFSTNGASIVAWNPTRMATGSMAFVLDLQGRRVRDWDFGVAVLGVVAIGDGSQVVVAQPGAVKCLAVGPGGITTLWRHDLTAAPSPISEMTALNGAVALVRHGTGLAAEFIDLNTGALLYSYDPEALAGKDPARSKSTFQGCTFHSGTTERQVVLRCHDSDGIALDLTTGTLTNLMIDHSTPPAMTLLSNILEGRMVLVGADSLRLRTIE